jgi:m7GpppX diphosphatase
VVVEPGWVYRDYVERWVEGQRGGGRLDWVANVLEGRSETADVLAREGDGMAEEGFVLLPDL